MAGEVEDISRVAERWDAIFNGKCPGDNPQALAFRHMYDMILGLDVLKMDDILKAPDDKSNADVTRELFGQEGDDIVRYVLAWHPKRMALVRSVMAKKR